MIAMKRRLLLLLLVCASSPLCLAKTYPHRWVFVSRLLRTDQDVADVERIVKTASAHGLNGMVLSAGLDWLDRQPAENLDRLASVRDICRQHGVEIVPNIFSVGYGGSVLAYDRNLAAGIPARDVPFLVEATGRGWIRMREPRSPMPDSNNMMAISWLAMGFTTGRETFRSWIGRSSRRAKRRFVFRTSADTNTVMPV